MKLEYILDSLEDGDKVKHKTDTVWKTRDEILNSRISVKKALDNSWEILAAADNTKADSLRSDNSYGLSEEDFRELYRKILREG